MPATLTGEIEAIVGSVFEAKSISKWNVIETEDECDG